MSQGRWSAQVRRLLGRDRPDASAARPPAGDPAPRIDPQSPDEALADLRRIIDEMRPQASFQCARHGTEAATVKLIRRFTEDSELIVESALGRGWHRLKTPADEAVFGDPVAEELQEVLARGDAAWLHFMNPRWAPFYCAQCQRVYCEQCWTLDEVPTPEHPDSPALRATCPEGHSFMLNE